MQNPMKATMARGMRLRQEEGLESQPDGVGELCGVILHRLIKRRTRWAARLTFDRLAGRCLRDP